MRWSSVLCTSTRSLDGALLAALFPTLLGLANAIWAIRTKIIVARHYIAQRSQYRFGNLLLAFSFNHGGQLTAMAWPPTHAKDYKKAMAILRPLAEHGDSQAQDEVGAIYLAGLSIPRDPVTGH